MRKNFKKIMATLTICACMSASVGMYAYAAGNVRDRMFHYKKEYDPDAVEPQYKANGTRTYVVYSEGSTPDVIVMGVQGKKQTTCSKKVRLKKYTKYTIKNTVHSKGFTEATLRVYAGGYGYGFWSPDSTKDYTNVG